MDQWVCLLIVVALVHCTAAAQAGDGAQSVQTAHVLYSAASGRHQRVELAPGTTIVLQNGPLEVVAPLLVVGATERPATISCSKEGPQAFIVRGTTLELQHVVVTGCIRQAVVLKGPGAVLNATAVTFNYNGPANTATVSAARTQPLGQVVAAEAATVELTDVTLIGNNGTRYASEQLWPPSLHPACKDATVAGGVPGRPLEPRATADRASITKPKPPRQQACGSPVLASSLIDLEQSNLVLRGCKLQDNTVDALITARGSSAHSLQLLAGTRLEGNRGRWLIVADAWSHDPVGRKNIMAPHPSEAVKGLDLEPPYTTFSLMGKLRYAAADSKEEEVGDRKLLQQEHQVQHRLQQQKRQEQAAVSPEAVVGRAPKGQVPLQVRFQGVRVSHNIVQSGLLWSRLVNTSMHDTDIVFNIGTGGNNSVAYQMQAVLAALPRAVTEAGQQDLANDREHARLAAQVAAVGNIVPPGPCDAGALHRALLAMHGPSAFNMMRCRVKHNIHFSGALLRVTDGLGPTSVRDSMLVNNTATAVLRFEGRTWVLKTDTFFAAIQFIDVLFNAQHSVAGAPKAAYMYAQLQLAQHQANVDKASYDAFWFMSNTSMVDNTVFHSLIMSNGSRTNWRAFLAAKAGIMQSGVPDAVSKAKTLPLTYRSTSWWMRGCTLKGNRLQVPGINSSTTTATTTNNNNTITATYPNEWAEAVPHATYSSALSAVLDADETLLSNLSKRGGACHSALKHAVDVQQQELQFQVALRAPAPAVLWASTTHGYIEHSNIADNRGFFHTLRMDNTHVAWEESTLINNTVEYSVFDLWYSDVWITSAEVIGNQVQSGSVLDFASCRGGLREILLKGNKAGSVRADDWAGTKLDEANCTQQGTVVGGASLSPIWSMSQFVGELHKATVSNNTGSIALNFSGMSLSAPLSELLVQNNNASGIRLFQPVPKFDKQPFELLDVVVVGNRLSPAAPMVGGLLIGGFTSGVAATMPIAITNCVFINNTPVQPVDTLTLQGGGVCIQAPISDSADDRTSQRGVLQNLQIIMLRTKIDGNMAAEGGGLWTAWPMIIEGCTFANNHAVVSGGGIYSKGLQQDSIGYAGAVLVNHTSIINNTAGFGGGIACDSCRAILAAEIDGNRAIRKAQAGVASTKEGEGGNGGGKGCSNGAGTLGGLNFVRQRHALLGAGGGIAANLAGNSYMVICVSGNGTSPDERGKSTLRNNNAQAFGGAVYLNSSVSYGCRFPQPGLTLTESCFPNGWWPKKCGFYTLDMDWQRSSASSGGDLLAWVGDASSFNMACTLPGAVCNGSNDTLHEDGNATNSHVRGPKNNSSLSKQGISIRPRPAGGGRRGSLGNMQQTCVHILEAHTPYVCAIGSGLTGKPGLDGGVVLVDETRKFQLPSSFFAVCQMGEVPARSTDTCIMCAEGTYSIDPRNHSCDACPVNAACPGGWQVVPMPGFWSSSPLSPQMHRCMHQAACVGGNNTSCAEGYQSTLCGACTPGWGASQHFTCRRCLKASAIITLYVLAAFAILGLIALLCYVVLHGSTAATGSPTQTAPPAHKLTTADLLKSLVLYSQWMWVLSQMPGVEWPSTLSVPLYVIAWLFSASNPQSLSLECVLSASGPVPVAVQIFALTMCMPMLAMLVFLCVDGVAVCWMPTANIRNAGARPRNGSGSVMHRSIAQGIVIVFAFLPTLLRALFSLFACTEVDRPMSAPYHVAAIGSFWLNDVSQACWQGYHRGLVWGAGVPLMTVFCVLLPATMLAFTIRYRRFLQQPSFRHYSFLFKSYKPSACFWEVVVVMQTIGLVAISVFALALGTKYAALMLTVLLTALLLAIVLHAVVKPYANAVAGQAALRGHVCLFFTAFAALAFVPPSVLTGPHQRDHACGMYVGAVVLLANLAHVVAVTWQMGKLTNWTSIAGWCRRLAGRTRRRPR